MHDEIQRSESVSGMYARHNQKPNKQKYLNEALHLSMLIQIMLPH